MGRNGHVTVSAYLVLVIFMVFTLVELAQGCYRRIDYHNQPHHHHYKKPPPKGHGHGYGGGYGHMPHMPHGHGGGYGSHSSGHGHGGYGMNHGGHRGTVHKGYSHGQSHHGEGYGGAHGGQDHYGTGHHDGYQMNHHGGGYGGESNGGHKGYSQGPSHGHSMPIVGGYGGHSSHGSSGSDGYGHGSNDVGPGTHSQVGYGHESGPSQELGYGPPGYGSGHNTGGTKGKRIKYQMYESSHYQDKSPPTTNSYQHSAPYFMQKGYGHSGPYPNTEYSNPVHASMQPPTDPNMFPGGGGEGRSPLNLDAADTADLIRNAYDTSKENEVVQPHGESPGVPLSSMEKGDPSMGNFDLNLNYNSEDLPAPFGAFSSPNAVAVNANGRFRKKLSSKFRGEELHANSPAMDAFTSQSQQVLHTVPSGPDYLENDTGAVGGTGSSGTEALIK